MDDQQIRAVVMSVLESPEHQGAWYGAADGAPRNTRGNGVFEAIKELAARDLEAVANGEGGGDATSR